MNLLNWVFTILSFQFSNHVFHSKTSFTIPDMKMTILNLWKKQTSSFYSTSLSWAYLEAEAAVMEGKEGAHGKIGGKECGTSRQPCAAFLHNPTKLCYFLFPIQNGPRFKQAKNNETKENTQPILTFWIGPFSLYFLFPHLISEHVMLPQKTVSFKFRPIQVYMRVQF